MLNLILFDRTVFTQIIGCNCHMKHTGAVLWLCEVDEIFHSVFYHILNLFPVSFQDVLQQAVDLQNFQAVLGHPAAHSDATKTLMEIRKEKSGTSERFTKNKDACGASV